MRKYTGLNLLAAFTLLAVALVTVLSTASAAPAFIDPSFKTTWERVDRDIDTLPNAGRGYIWGPTSLYSGTEPYNSTTRRVQYFDKARMEINDPNADPNNLFYVTTGLLVKEMVTGVEQDGDNIYVPKRPSLVQVVGDPNDNGQNSLAPTYSTFNGLVSFFTQVPASNRVGQAISEAVDRDARVTTISPPVIVNYSDYDTVTQHNIAEVFVNYGKQTGPIWNGSTYVNGSVFFNNPTYVFGRPITEGYWTKAAVGGVIKDVLVQLFERRVLTYTPANSPKDRVEMGNVGQHYFKWRYLQGGGGSPAPTATPTSTPGGGATATPTPTATPISVAGNDFSQFRAPFLRSGGIPQGVNSGNVLTLNVGSAFVESSPVIDFANNLAIIGADNKVAAVTLSDNPVVAWSFSVTSANFSATPSFYNGVVYIGTTTGRVYALNSRDGTERWHSSISGDRIKGAPVSDGTNVYYGSRDKKLYAVRASDATPVWQTVPLDGTIEAGPILAPDGTIIVATNVGTPRLYGIGQNGSILWSSFQLDGGVVNTPALYNNVVYVGTTNGTLYAFNTNGVLRTSRTFNAGRGILTSPAISGGRVYVGSDDTSVYGIDLNNFNSTLFQVTTAGAVRSSIAVLDGFVYFASDDKQVYKVEITNTANKIKLLPSAASQPFGLNSIIVANGRAYIAGVDGTFYTIK